MRFPRRGGLRVALVLVASTALLRSGPAQAQDASAVSTLAGYQGSAAASGVRALYNPAGLLPIAAPVDLGAPDALATVTSGPTTYARSSVADPGDLLANPSALLSLADPSLSGSVPPYPYRVSATSGIGQPRAEVAPAPGLDARVSADESGSSATATMPALEAPAVLTVGTLSASASTTVTATAVTVHSHTALAGVDLLGLVKIGGIVTDLTATSGDGPPKLTGGTTITGATVLGQAVTIDANGIHTGNGSSGANPLVTAVDQALRQVGVHVAVASPVDLAGGGSGQLTAAGVRIDLEVSPRTFPEISQLLRLIPSMDSLVPGLPSLDDVLAAARAQHLVSLAVGGASVALATSTTGPAVGSPPSSSGSPALLGGGDVGLSTVPSGTGLALDRVAPTVSSPGRSVPASAHPPVDFGEGVGLIALLALLVQPLLGHRLALWATTLLAPDGASSCPLEGRP